jgi:hypothetical protein
MPTNDTYAQAQIDADRQEYYEWVDNITISQFMHDNEIAERQVRKCAGAFETIFSKSPDGVYLYDIFGVRPCIIAIVKSDGVIFQYEETVEWCSGVYSDAFQLVYHPKYKVPAEYKFKLIFNKADYDKIIENSIMRDIP